MMNWIYNWYDPHGKLKVSELVDNVTRLFLHGFVAGLPAEELDFAPQRMRRAAECLARIIFRRGQLVRTTCVSGWH